MTSDSATPDLEVRHRPVQERGRVRFDAILSAARELLAEGGLEGFTIEDVAAHAEIPVGSVYQFFPNKFAIVAELDSRDTEALIDDLMASSSRLLGEVVEPVAIGIEGALTRNKGIEAVCHLEAVQ